MDTKAIDDYLLSREPNKRIDSRALPGFWYSITHLPGEYLGCVLTNAKGYGNDLADGPDSPETWLRIIQDVVDYEDYLRAERPR